MTDSIEVFRDLKLRMPFARRAEMREALAATATAPWQFDSKRTAEIVRNSGSSKDVLYFQHQKTSDFPASGLALWGIDEGYYVSNIVPLEIGNLTFAQYNAILEDFLTRVIQPLAEMYEVTIDTTASRQTIDDWLSPDAATKLRRFSAAANKSSGASHPLDEKRWFDFIIAARRARDKPGTDQLARWLNEVEGWDEKSAHDLAGDYETSLALLTYYDEH